jgi:hypothetical protein
MEEGFLKSPTDRAHSYMNITRKAGLEVNNLVANYTRKVKEDDKELDQDMEITGRLLFICEL